MLCVWTSEKAITKNCAGPNHLFHNFNAKAANCPPIAPSSVLNRKKKKKTAKKLSSKHKIWWLLLITSVKVELVLQTKRRKTHWWQLQSDYLKNVFFSSAIGGVKLFVSAISRSLTGHSLNSMGPSFENKTIKDNKRQQQTSIRCFTPSSACVALFLC